MLDFSRNHVEGIILESIGSMKNLQGVNLGSDVLSSTIAFVVGNFTKSIFLDLFENATLVIEIPLNTQGA